MRNVEGRVKQPENEAAENTKAVSRIVQRIFEILLLSHDFGTVSVSNVVQGKLSHPCQNVENLHSQS